MRFAVISVPMYARIVKKRRTCVSANVFLLAFFPGRKKRKTKLKDKF